MAAVGPRRRVVRDAADQVAENGVQLRRQRIAGQIGREEIGEAAARCEEVTFRPQIGQHVGKDGRDADGAEGGDEREADEERLWIVDTCTCAVVPGAQGAGVDV